MAAVTITPNNDRVDDAESSLGWSSLGGGQGPSAEGSFPYQGGNLINKKITGTGGVRYDPVVDGGAARDVTGQNKTWMVKGIVTDYGGLNALSGVRVHIGSSTSAYVRGVLAGTAAKRSSLSAYPQRGGLIIVPFDPNVVAFRDGTVGSPSLTEVDYFGFEANFDSSTAKAENVGCDAIDIGTGLTLLGGDGTSADGTWQDFVDADQGTVGNRWGYASSTNREVFLFFGRLTIGGAAATVFNDSDAKILWPDGLFAPGFSGPFADLSNAGSYIYDGASHSSLGSALLSDTRADFTWFGTAGVGIAAHKLENFRNYIMTSAVTMVGADVECVSLAQNGGSISNSILRSSAVAGDAMLVNPNMAQIDGVEFVQSADGHAIVFTAPGSYNLDSLRFTGFGANETTSAAVYNNSGGLVTLNIVNNGQAPTFRNGAGASTAVSNPKIIEFTLSWDGGTPPADYEWRLYVDDPALGIIGTVELAGAEAESGATATLQYSYTYSGETPVVLQVMAAGFVERLFSTSLRSTDQSLPVFIEKEENQ